MKESLRAMAPSRRALVVSGWAVLVFSPFALLLLIGLLTGCNAFAARPVWPDELSYWRGLFAWNQMGFEGGLNGLYEQAARYGILGTDGLSPIVLYGWFVKLFGLSEASILLGNAVWVSLGALVCCALLRPSPGASLSLAALFALFPPVILYVTTSMTEVFGYALALMYAPLLIRTVQTGKGRYAALLLALVTLAALHRALYALLALPVLAAYAHGRPGRLRVALCALAALGLSAGCMAASFFLEAPNPQGFVHHLLQQKDFSMFLSMLFSHAKANVLEYFTRPATFMEAALRLTYLCVAAACLVGAFTARRRKKGARVDAELLGCFGLLTAAWGLTLTFYEVGDWVDYRMLSPFLWLTLAYLLLRRRVVLPRAVLAAGAITLAVMLSQPATGAFADPNRFTPAPEEPALSQAISAVVYDAQAENPLTNTVRTDVSTLQAMRELDPGLGLQFGWFTTDTTGQSAWILTDRLKCAVNGYERVADTGGYKVYRLIESYEEE